MIATPPLAARTAGRHQVIAWALWDCGATGLNAIAVTFVFSIYLTASVGAEHLGDTSSASWLGRAMTVAGVAVALLAPVIGVWADLPRRRRTTLGLLTGAGALLTASMSLIRDDASYLWIGLALLALTAACSDLASVPYNAMLRQVTTQQTSGRVSGLGSAAGYVGTVVLLLLIYVGFIAGDGPSSGLLGLPTDDGQNVRAAMLLTAAWFVLFALPVLISVPSPPDPPDASKTPIGVLAAYRKLWSDITGEWTRDRNLLYYLVASAVFRDGLAGVFAFGAVLGVNVYGVSEADVLLFGVAACVVAAVGAVVGGHFDDRIGSKPVILGSLAAIIVVGSVMIGLSGQLAFWVCGLLLCLFLGPAQASARTMVLRMSPEGREGMAFGLYTTTGRAVSFLSPWLFFMFIDLFGTDQAGMGGLLLVVAAGLAAMLAVRTPGLHQHA